MGTPDLVSPQMQCAATSTQLLISRSTLQLSNLSDAAPKDNQVAAQPCVSTFVCGLTATLTLHASNDSINDFGKSQLQADTAVVQHVYRIIDMWQPLKQRSLSVDFITTQHMTWTRRLGKTVAGKWTGVRLRDLLQKCYAHSYQEGARHVHLNGVEREVPLGKMGCYGTSIPLSSANNAANDIIVAYKHNGKARSAVPYLLCERATPNSLAD